MKIIGDISHIEANWPYKDTKLSEKTTYLILILFC